MHGEDTLCVEICREVVTLQGVNALVGPDGHGGAEIEIYGSSVRYSLLEALSSATGSADIQVDARSEPGSYHPELSQVIRVGRPSR